MCTDLYSLALRSSEDGREANVSLSREQRIDDSMDQRFTPFGFNWQWSSGRVSLAKISAWPYGGSYRWLARIRLLICIRSIRTVNLITMLDCAAISRRDHHRGKIHWRRSVSYTVILCTYVFELILRSMTPGKRAWLTSINRGNRREREMTKKAICIWIVMWSTE
jgi:hypothetical protein